MEFSTKHTTEGQIAASATTQGDTMTTPKIVVQQWTLGRSLRLTIRADGAIVASGKMTADEWQSSARTRQTRHYSIRGTVGPLAGKSAHAVEGLPAVRALVARWMSEVNTSDLDESEALVCECELDYNCHLHAGRMFTFIETRYQGLDDEEVSA
jgi:hypothetical protein